MKRNALALVVSAGLIAVQQFDYNRANEANELAQDLIQNGDLVELEDEQVPLAQLPAERWSDEPMSENVLFLKEMDLAALQEVNPEVLGWIHVPDTELSYPLLQTVNNDIYLNKAWDGTRNSGGSIFLECENPADFSAFNTIIYGHRMTNNSMFGSLRHYTTEEYLKEHPSVYIVMEGEVRQYNVFSAYEAPVTSPTYWLNIEKEGHKETALEHFVNSSGIESGLTPSVEDQFITLSTCTGTGTYHSRWVVQAVLANRWERL